MQNGMDTLTSKRNCKILVEIKFRVSLTQDEAQQLELMRS